MGFRVSTATMIVMRLLNVSFCVLVVVAPSGAQAGYLTDGFAKVLRAMSSVGDVYSPGSLGQIVRFYEAQMYHAAIDAIVPTFPFLRNIASPSLDFYQLRRCPRVDVHKCLYHGNSSNGLPPQLQGVLWQNGVGYDEVAISTVGDWDPVKKTLFIGTWRARNWAGRGTASVKDSNGLFYLPAGSAHLNALATTQLGVLIQFNENVTFGQAYGTIPLLTIPVIAPKFIIDWTLELLPDGSWLRKSRTLGLPEPGGDYILKPIVTGDGKPGPFYDKWVKDMGGQDFLYLDKIFP